MRKMVEMVETVELVDRPARGGPWWNRKLSEAINRAKRSTSFPERSDQPTSAFTLVELLVTISIIGILLTLGIAKYQQFNRRQILVQAARDLKSNLRLAQDKALAGEKPTACVGSLSGHKLEFINDRDYKIVAVCENEVDVKTDLSLGPNITKSGASSVLFKVLSQGVEAAASFTLTAYGLERRVVVETTGNISLIEPSLIEPTPTEPPLIEPPCWQVGGLCDSGCQYRDYKDHRYYPGECDIEDSEECPERVELYQGSNTCSSDGKSSCYKLTNSVEGYKDCDRGKGGEECEFEHPISGYSDWTECSWQD